MYYIGLDLHKKTISYCVKNAAGSVYQEGKIGSTRKELDAWTQSLPQSRTIAMEATIFSGRIYDHLLPHASAIKVAHPLTRQTPRDSLRQRPGADFPALSRLGHRLEDRSHSHSAGKINPERRHGKFQRKAARRVPERELVRNLFDARRKLSDWKTEYNNITPAAHIARWASSPRTNLRVG
jgi:hypothetical protein